MTSHGMTLDLKWDKHSKNEKLKMIMKEKIKTLNLQRSEQVKKLSTVQEQMRFNVSELI